MSYQVNSGVSPGVARAPERVSFDEIHDNASRIQNCLGFPRQSISPTQVLKSFNTRAFKREQPDNSDLMLQFVAEAIARSEPVSFVLYWGKGPRCHAAEPEVRTLDNLAALARRVQQSYQPGALLTLICTDTHAQLNGHSQESIRTYFDDIALCARQRGFETRWLGELIRGVDLRPQDDLGQQEVPPELLSTLCNSAMKWFRGDGTVVQGAIRYYRMNMIEKRVVELTFPRSIFVTFNGSELRELFPSHLPIFYMFSLRHGVSDKPWFLPAKLPPGNAPSTSPQLANGS